MSSHVTFQQRLERVLLDMAESAELTIAQRLDATRQLTALKRVRPPRARVKPKAKVEKSPSAPMFGSK